MMANGIISVNRGKTCTAGLWKLYKDEVVAAQGIGQKTGHVIQLGRPIVLAQEQDSPGGSITSYQSFIGMLTNANIWYHVLPIAHIEQMSKSCLLGQGNFTSGQISFMAVKEKPELYPISLQTAECVKKFAKGVINIAKSSQQVFVPLL